MAAAQEQQRRVWRKQQILPSFLRCFKTAFERRSPFVTKIQKTFVADY